MIDAPGPWGTGPFVLAEGSSSLDAEQATISEDPFACTWLWHGDRTPRLRLVANRHFWNRRRGPRLQEVVFRNDLPARDALELACTTEGEVDLVTSVAPEDAERVARSEHAQLVTIDALRALAGVFDRGAEDLPLGDRRARQALNLAIDRRTLVGEAMFGRARPLGGLTPPTALTVAHRLGSRLLPYPHDPALARELWRAAGGEGARRLRLAAPKRFERVARHVAAAWRAVLGVEVEILLHDADAQREIRRALAGRTRPLGWDVLLVEHAPQSADVPAHELHRGFAGATGEYRAGPVSPEFEALYEDLVRQTSQVRLVQHANRVDRFFREQALALFLCAPDGLYAVNREVDFKPYRTTFELAETSVGAQHWSRRQDGW